MWYEVVEGHPDAVKELQKLNRWKAMWLNTRPKPEILREIMFQFPAPQFERARNFSLAAYLTSGRRNELLALRKCDFTYKTLDYMNQEWKVLVALLFNEKAPNIPFKTIPLVFGLDDVEDEMLKALETYLATIPSDNNKLFPCGKDTTTYDKKLERCILTTRYRDVHWPIEWAAIVKFRLFPHYLRHCRLTHWAPLGMLPIVQMAGWSGSQMGQNLGTMLDHYVRRDWESIAQRRIVMKI